METEVSNSEKILKSIVPQNSNEKDEKPNLYTHIKQLLKTKNLINDDEKFDDLFEDISIRIKNKGYYILDEDNSTIEYITKILNSPNSPSIFQTQFDKEKNLMKPNVKTEEGAEATP